MRYLVILALLLASPANAYERKPPDSVFHCEFVKLFYEYCTPEKLKEYEHGPIINGAMAHSFQYFRAHHPNISDEKMFGLCKRVTNGELTPDDAQHRLGKFCPKGN
ncbi:hypothetical protein ACVWZ4_003803 [Bradyrhizobium sp. USDA 4472]